MENKTLKVFKNSIFFKILLSFFTISLILYSLFFFTNTKEAQVAINDNGFSKEVLLIQRNTRVIFKNTGSLAHWPASDNHPTHTEYPGGGGCIGSKLDACRGLKPGETYAFVFDRVGNWGLHDHLFPDFTVRIKVIENKSLSASILEYLSNWYSRLKYSPWTVSPEVFRKMPNEKKKEFIIEYSKKDPQKAWTYLKEAMFVNGQTIGYSHELSHIIGREIYKKYGIEGISICTREFSSGCYHGVVSYALSTEGISSVRSIEKQCMKVLGDREGENPQECIHGVGHGLASLHNLQIDKALNDCELLYHENSKIACQLGIFMEYSISAAPSRVDLKDPWKFCTDLKPEYRQRCMSQYPALILRQNPNLTTKEFGALCMKNTDDKLRQSCFWQLGAIITSTNLGNEEKILEACNKIDDNKAQIYCKMASSYQAKYDRLPNWPQVSKSICQKIPQDFAAQCLQNLTLLAD